MQLFGKTEWTERSPLNTKRRGFGVAQVRDVVYVIGGFSDHFLSSVEAYDPQTDTWTEKSPMNVPRRNLGTVVVDGKIFAIGGFSVKNTFEIDSDAIEVYDPETDTWTLLSTPLKTPRHSFGIDLFEGQIVIVGGSNCFGFLDSVDAFDPLTHRWHSLSPLTLKRNGLGSVSANGSLFAIGGYDGQSVGIVERLDRLDGQWRRVFVLPPRSIFGICLFNGLVFCAGGFRDGEILSSVDVFDPSSNSHGSISPLLTPRANFRLVPLSTFILAIGGSFDRDTLLSSVESW